MVWRGTALSSLPVSSVLNFKRCVVTAENSMHVSVVNDSAEQASVFATGWTIHGSNRGTGKGLSSQISRPPLGSTQLPTQLVPGLLSGG
jgi:hypothetical protein